MNLKCEFCTKTFSSQSNLNFHKLNAKYCLEKQNKIREEVKCEYCNKTLHKNSMKKHLINCSEYLIFFELNQKNIEINNLKLKLEEKENLINELKKEKDAEIEFLKKELEEFKKKAYILEGKNELGQEVYNDQYKCIEKVCLQTKTRNTTTNNVINNLVVYDENVLLENIQQIINEQLTPQVVIDGQVGLARILAPRLKETNMIACSDKSRAVIVSIDKDGNVTKDMKANKLVSLIGPIANQKVDKILNDDFDRRNKLDKIPYLESRIEECWEKINDVKSFMRGLSKDSTQWYNEEKRIKEYEKQIEQYKMELYELQDDDLEITEQHFLPQEKLIDGGYEIKNLEQDATKFSTAFVTKV